LFLIAVEKQDVTLVIFRMDVNRFRRSSTFFPEVSLPNRKTQKVMAPAVKGASEPDMDVVRRFREGDPTAFDEVFETFSPLLLGFLTRMCGNPEDARESLQDTFVTIFKYLGSFRGDSSLKNWLFRIAVTACLKMKRRRKTFLRIPEEAVSCSPDDFPEAWPEPSNGQARPQWQRNPEELYMDKEFRGALIRGVAAMPYKYKIVMNLRDFEGFSTEETSKLLGIKPSTVKVRLHRARLHLKEWLRKQHNL